MDTRNQYLQTLIKEHGYHLLPKGEKTKLLDEYCKNTKQNRKYVIHKIRNASYLKSGKRLRKSYYDNYAKVALIRCWDIFDRPSGQRLAPLLREEVDRLRRQKELLCPDMVAEKLKKISPRTIDEKLKRHKEKERLTRTRKAKVHPLLYQKIPIKIFAEQDRGSAGNIQIDFVEHCGATTRGHYVNTLSTTDIAYGWWEGEAIMGSGKQRAQEAVDRVRGRYPFDWNEIHSDNGASFINGHLYNYTFKEGMDFSRSRPYQKNDNCLVEQKNWTHVKKHVGYLRYDTEEELAILNDLYQNELRLYKNFFQSVMKLVSKERVGGKIHRKYDKVKTPYRRVLECDEVPKHIKYQLTKTYESLNPAKLKRSIDYKLNLLWKAYEKKQPVSLKAQPNKKIKPRLVTSYIAQRESVWSPS